MQNRYENHTPRAQRGLTLTGLITVCVVIGLAALLVMKVIPEYIEYGAIKRDVTSVVRDSATANSSIQDIKNAFNKRAGVDNITRVTGNDLEIIKNGDRVTISFAYAAQIPLVANISLVIDFNGSASN